MSYIYVYLFDNGYLTCLFHAIVKEVSPRLSNFEWLERQIDHTCMRSLRCIVLYCLLYWHTYGH